MSEDIVTRHPLDKPILVGTLRPILVEALREFFGRSDLSGPQGQSFIETCEAIAAKVPEATTIATLRAELEAMRGFADLWYFVMDEKPLEFERIVCEYTPSRWMSEATKLRAAITKEHS